MARAEQAHETRSETGLTAIVGERRASIVASALARHAHSPVPGAPADGASRSALLAYRAVDGLYRMTLG